jgi:small-conductance mechanosensitive channel
MRYLSLLLLAFLFTFSTLPAAGLCAADSPPESATPGTGTGTNSADEGAAEKSTESLEEELAEKSSRSLEEEIAQNPLIPPNTSSPRATLRGFTESMNLAYSVLMEAHNENHKTPGLLVSSSVERKEELAEELLKRSTNYLDLSLAPEEFRAKVGQEHALMLKEILDRIEVPPLDEIPGIKAIEKEEEEEKISELDRWRIPNTDIVIAKVVEGPRKDEYLFTPQTVGSLEEFYARVEYLPYREDQEVTRAFYEFFISTPGSLLPPKWGKWLPVWSTQLVFGQTIWQWFALITIPIIALMAIWLTVRVWISRSAELSTTVKITGWVIVVFATVAVVMAINYVLDSHVNISGSTLVFVESILTKFFILILPVIVIWEALKSSITKQVPVEEEAEEDSDDEWGARSLSRGDTLLVIVRKFLVIIILTVACFLLLSAMGINIGPLLAGAGVIGIAIGFGSQKLISDVLSGVFFLIDDAFRVGEYIEAGGVSGTVEAITLRNVMLRHHRGMLQIVPYSELVSITNFMRGGLVVKFSIELPYDTDIDKVRKIIKKVGIAMLEDPEIGADFIRPVKSQGVRSVGDSVMVIRVKFTAKPGKHFLIRREAFRRISEALAAKGIYYAHRKVIVEMPEAETQESETESVPGPSTQGMAGAAAGLENIVSRESQQSTQPKGDNL